MKTLEQKKENFICRSNEIHGSKYDYSKIEYINNRTKVCILCPEHGEFYQTPAAHLRKQKCPKCAGIVPPTTIEWIERAVLVHGDKYDYSKTIYTRAIDKVCIICPIHGEFYLIPSNHVDNKQGCPKCGIIRRSKNAALTKSMFVDKSNNKHEFKYDYSNVEYINNSTSVHIICPEHGGFYQTPDNHMVGKGCSMCRNVKMAKLFTSTTEIFLKKAKEIRDDYDKYDYSKVEYVNAKTKICIICKEHGEFWQTPNGHLSKKTGCPNCKKKWKLEEAVKKFLLNKNINFIHQAHFEWLGRMSLDFYLPDHNIGIECQGGQHFIPVDFSGKGEDWANAEMVNLLNRDCNKFNLCKDNNIKLIYHYNKKFDSIFYNDKFKIHELDKLNHFLI